MTRGAVIPKTSLPRRGYAPARSSYPASELPTREQPVKEPGTEAVLTIALVGAYPPPCSDGDDTTMTRLEQRSYSGFYFWAAHWDLTSAGFTTACMWLCLISRFGVFGGRIPFHCE
jgi:hypothetical protein